MATILAGPKLTVVEKTLLRGRGGKRVRAIIMVEFGDEVVGEDIIQHRGGYYNGVGFSDSTAPAKFGIDIQSVLPDPILNVDGRIVQPAVHDTGSFGFDDGFEGGKCFLEFAGIEVSNYVKPGPIKPFKHLFVKDYGVTDAPALDEAASSVSETPVSEDSFAVVLEYTPVSGGEA